jgi:signal recognition particle receptor subunit beta
MVSMKTRTERTLFFDFLPIDLGDIGGFKTRFLLYTVPGQVYYNATRKLVLRGVDAIIFVADSGRGKMDENVESLQNLNDNLKEYGLDINEIPYVIQYNKRDLPDVYSIEELEQALNPMGVPSYEGVATTGDGVFEAFRGIAKLLLAKLGKEIKLGSGKDSRKAPVAASPPQAKPIAPPATPDQAPAQSPAPGGTAPYRPTAPVVPDAAAAPPPAAVTPPAATPPPVEAPTMSDVAAELQSSLDEPAPEPVAAEPTPPPVMESEPVIEEPVSAPSGSSEDEWTDEHAAAEEAALAEAIKKRSAAKAPDDEDEIEDEEDVAIPDSGKKKGFWGRLFKRKKKYESVEEWEEHDGEAHEDEEPAAEPAYEAPPVPVAEPAIEPVYEATPDPVIETAPEPVLEPAAYEAPDPEPVASAPVAETPETPETQYTEVEVPGSLTENPETRLAEVEIPSSLGSEDLSPVIITRQIQVPISLNAEEIRRGAKLRLALEIEIIPSEGTGTGEGTKVA